MERERSVRVVTSSMAGRRVKAGQPANQRACSGMEKYYCYWRAGRWMLSCHLLACWTATNSRELYRDTATGSCYTKMYNKQYVCSTVGVLRTLAIDFRVFDRNGINTYFQCISLKLRLDDRTEHNRTDRRDRRPCLPPWDEKTPEPSALVALSSQFTARARAPSLLLLLLLNSTHRHLVPVCAQISKSSTAVIEGRRRHEKGRAAPLVA
jgi:hypothetical protein